MFDGRVVEIWGLTMTEVDTMRLPLQAIELRIGEPDRKGRREVDFAVVRPRPGGGASFKVEPEDWPQVAPLLERVAAAIPPR
ncbi:MAG: hypothetical protein WD844_02525 [Thermoleophilaceae bacterium]